MMSKMVHPIVNAAAIWLGLKPLLVELGLFNYPAPVVIDVY